MDDRSSLALWRVGSRRPDFRGKRRNIVRTTETLKSLLAHLGGSERSHLNQLWRNWSMVMGADIAGIAIPLGSRKQVLLVGAEDNMALQELTYQIPEMLERANGFMDSDYFSRVELHLLLGQTALDARIAAGEQAMRFTPREAPPKPENLGGLTTTIDPHSAVGRCYAAYLKAFGIR